MKNKRPSQIRRLKSYELAHKLAYKYRGAEYDSKINPYKTAFEIERFQRFYNQHCDKYRFAKSEFEDMAMVYGLDLNSLKEND